MGTEPESTAADWSLPELCEGWDWYVVRYVEQPAPDDLKGWPRPKVRVALIDYAGADRAHGTIDVDMYGDTAAVVELARALVTRVANEQLAGLSAAALPLPVSQEEPNP